MAYKKTQLEKMRHSASHILAAAVLKLYPKVKLGIGPAIQDGFYYDFDFGQKKISDQDLTKISASMNQFIKARVPFEKKEVSAKKAKEIFKNEPYKLELIDELVGEGTKQVSLYQCGDFVDLCAGPHVVDTGQIGPFKLLSIAGAYWRGSEKNKMLTRIYGTCFSTQKELDKHLEMLEKAEERNHKKIGNKLELFLFHKTAPGMAYWLPKGAIIYNKLIDFWRAEHEKYHYQEIISPLINKRELYETSGHWDHYKKHMFISKTGKGEIYALKPMNCPNAMIVFASKIRSYKDLPLKLGDTDTLHRHEKSGTLNGLLRIREFRQDDAHIFIEEDKIKQAYKELFEITKKFYSVFDLSYSFRLGTRPKDFMGDLKLWNKAEAELEEILKSSGKDYSVLKGDGAFYGPKIDILMKDSLNRDWQTGTLQLDFQIPRRFSLKYIAKDGTQKIPAVVHRVIYGSLERFIGILIEHYAGAFPVWLSPVQVAIIPITDKHLKYAQSVLTKFISRQIRAKLDDRRDTTSTKIRDAEMQKIPYMLVVGDREVEAKKVNVRVRGEKVLGSMALEKFFKLIQEDIAKKRQF